VGDLLQASGRARDVIPLPFIQALCKNAYSLQVRRERGREGGREGGGGRWREMAEREETIEVLDGGEHGLREGGREGGREKEV